MSTGGADALDTRLLEAIRPQTEGRARWLLVVSIILLLSTNHWARDSLGALEVPLEDPNGLFALSVVQYNALTTSYFVPNIVIPLLGGGIAQLVGPANAIVFFCFVSACGNSLVALSAFTQRYWILFIGRACMGLGYEAIDVLPIGLLSHRFRDCWATMVGVISASNRVGSVTNFLIEPAVLSTYGLRVALILPSIVGITLLVWATMAHRVDALLRRHAAKLSHCASTLPDGGSGEGGSEVNPSPVYCSHNTSPDVAHSFNGTTVQDTQAVGFLSSLRRAKKELKASFFFYALAFGCTYGSVVPFWFIGSKHLQERFGMSISRADTVMLIPEGSILLLALPIGILADKCELGPRPLLAIASVSTILIGLSLLALALAPIPPVPGCVLLGSCYAVASSLGWVIIAYIAPPRYINLCSGFIGSTINIVPALLPLTFTGKGAYDLLILAVVALVGSASYLIAAVGLSRRSVERVELHAAVSDSLPVGSRTVPGQPTEVIAAMAD